MWEVCSIDWTTGKVTPATDKNGGYKITPCYHNPYYMPGPGC